MEDKISFPSQETIHTDADNGNNRNTIIVTRSASNEGVVNNDGDNNGEVDGNDGDIDGDYDDVDKDGDDNDDADHFSYSYHDDDDTLNNLKTTANSEYDNEKIDGRGEEETKRDDNTETSLNVGRVGLTPFESKEATDLSQHLHDDSKLRVTKNRTKVQETNSVFADLVKKMPRLKKGRMEDHEQQGKRFNASESQRKTPSLVSREETNIVDLNEGEEEVRLVRPLLEEKLGEFYRHTTRYGQVRPIPPPSGFSRNFVSKPNSVPSTLPNDPLEVMEYYSKPSICPLLGLSGPRKSRERASCIPREVDASSCLRALKEYDLNSKPLICANQSHQQLCSFKVKHPSSNQNGATVDCDISECGTNPVYVLEISPVFGILKERALWKRFVTSKGLASYLKRYSSQSDGFNFCFLACIRKGGSGFIEQLFSFPVLYKLYGQRGNLRDKAGFNLNILVLDSVSRPHFYRALPKTAKTLREIVHFKFYNSSVLDFEMMQSTAAYTFHNIRALMSGKQDFHYSGGHVNETYGIDVLFGKFKKLGFYTLLQEDSCWYDSWGSLFTNNKYQGATPTNKSAFAQRWRNFQDLVKQYFLDDFGLSHASCEVLKRYNTTNQFNHPKKVCFGGRAFAEHFLDYAESIYSHLRTTGTPVKVLSYTHLNIGHEITGTRVQQIDERLSRYVDKMATAEDTLTILLSDHGPKTTRFSFHTMEGRAEKYDPFLFFIIPGKVASSLGSEIFQALIANQNRLMTTLDIHKAFMSLGEKDFKGNPIVADRGIFNLIPAKRTCANLSIKPLAVCKCKYWETRFPDNDIRFYWLAEYALGNLNNIIQEQYLGGAKDVKGYGNCQRLIGRRFSKIRQRFKRGIVITTMDIEVMPGNEIFEVQLRHSGRNRNKQQSFIKMAHYERITIYRHFRKCVDSSVSLGLCVCNYSNNQPIPTRKKPHRWVHILSRKDIFDIISLSNSFGVETKIKDIHQGCLLLMYRNHESRSSNFEISNTCGDRIYKVTVSVTKAKHFFFSRKIPFSILVQQRTIHFLLVVKPSEKTNLNFKLRINHSIKYLKNYMSKPRIRTDK